MFPNRLNFFFFVVFDIRATFCFAAGRHKFVVKHTGKLQTQLLRPPRLAESQIVFNNEGFICVIFYRPGVAGAVLQTPLLPIN